MNFDKQILSDILREYEIKRELHAKKLNERKLEVYRKIPRIKQIDSLLKSTAASVMRIALENGDDPEEALKQLKEQNLALQRERRELLIKNNIPADFLDDKPDCSICSDMGYIGSKPCRCLKHAYQDRLNKQLSTILPINNQNFESFKFFYYPQTIDPTLGISSREKMQNNFNYCKKYAKTFNENSENLLFYGSTGLGKTFLSSCIAKVVTESGFSVAYDTTTNIISNYETVKFNGAESEQAKQNIYKYENADLLILDDLGTEFSTPFSVSIIYSLVNSRLMSHKPMIISTNFLPDDLEKRYSAAISSRINGEFTPIRFIGKDIRRTKRKASEQNRQKAEEKINL